MKNGLENNKIRVIIFKEGAVWYGVALELNIVESGDDPREVSIMLDEAVRGYLETVQKTKSEKDVLNQKIDPEYEKLWNETQGQKQVKSPYKIYSSGLLVVSSLV